MWPTLDSQHQTLDSVYHRKEWTELLSFANYSHTDGHGTRPLIRWQKPHMPVFSYTCYDLSRFSYSVLLNVIMEINLSRGKPRDIFWGTMLDRLTLLLRKTASSSRGCCGLCVPCLLSATPTLPLSYPSAPDC